jgi:hypothetical protein
VYIWTEGDTPALEEEAKWIAFEVLAPAYPGHSLSVRAYLGGFFIRDLRFPNGWGMNCPKTSELYSASAYKKKVIMLFGEWLERANEKRGLCEDGQEIVSVDGVPLHNQPPSQKAPIEAVIATSDQALRTTPRPQALG